MVNLKSYIVNHKSLTMAFVSIGVSFLLYANTLSGEFLFDDLQFVNNPLFFRLEFLPHLLFRPGTVGVPVSGYRPVTYMSMNLQLALLGERPFTFHLVNIMLNAAAIFLIFQITNRLFHSFRLAVITALLFAFFPIHTENVAYIKARDDLLSVTLALWAWLLLLQGKRWWSGFVFFLALLAKELVFFAPILYFLVPKSVQEVGKRDILKSSNLTSHFKNPLRTSHFARLNTDLGFRMYLIIPILLAFFTYVAIRFIVFGPFAFSGNAIARIFNPLGFADAATKFWTNWKITGMYIVKTFVPYNLSAGYQYNHLKLINNPFGSWEVWVGIGSILLLFAFFLHPKTRSTPLGVGAIAFGAFFIPIPKVLFQGADIFAERWMYGPSVGLAMIGGYIFEKIINFKFQISNFKLNPGWSLFIIILIAYTSIIFPRNLIWHSQLTAFTSMVLDGPDNMYAWYVLARDYYGDGDLENAERMATRGYELDPNFPYPELRYLRAQIAYHQGNYPLAKQHLDDAAELVNFATQIHGMYALILTKEGNVQGALDYLEEKRGQFEPKDPWIQIIMGGSYYALGDKEKAKEYLGWDTQTNDFRARKQLDNFLRGNQDDSIGVNSL